jgi:hypothetical protein
MKLSYVALRRERRTGSAQSGVDHYQEDER